MKTYTTLLTLLLTAAPTIAQDSGADAAPFVLPAGKLKTTDLIDSCAAYLEWNILYAEVEFPEQAATTKLQRQVVTDRDGCEELLYSLLYRQGYAVKALDLKRDMYEVLAIQGQRGREISAGAPYVACEQVLARPTLKRQVLTTLSLKHINAQLATNAIRPFFANAGGGFPGGVGIGNVGDRQSLLLQGFQDQVAQAIRVVQLADVPQRPELEILGGRTTMKDYVQGLEARIQALEKKLAAIEQKAK